MRFLPSLLCNSGKGRVCGAFLCGIIKAKGSYLVGCVGRHIDTCPTRYAAQRLLTEGRPILAIDSQSDSTDVL